MTTYVRSFNPVWIFRDLEGQPLDDTYYAFWLEPDLPYLPKNVHQDATGLTAWSNPMQLLANGALPNNMYFDPTGTYRLEIRAGNTQADQLIYEVNNYVIGVDGGGTPDNTIDLLPSNQLTNPQFQTVYFNTSTVITTAGTFSIAPGWEVVTSGGSGTSLTVTQLIKAGTDRTEFDPSPPYTLQFASTGFTSVKLRTRFNGNGALWQRRAAAFTGTFKSSIASKQITVTYEPSSGDPVVLLSAITTVGVYKELLGAADIPGSTNATANNLAYVDVVINIPVESTIELGNLQLLGQDSAAEIGFKEDTIERYIDNTFHLYEQNYSGDTTGLASTASLLAGWYFANNPWQFTTPSTKSVNPACTYTADQTIISQRGGADQVSTERASVTKKYGLTVTAVTGASQFAMIQYIDPAIMRGVWNNKMSSVVKVDFLTTNSTVINLKARLMYRASLPATLSPSEPVATWNVSNEPELSAGWTPVVPLNDPSYTLGATNSFEFRFPAMENVASTNADMTLGIMVYITNTMSAAGTPDAITFHNVSLIPNPDPVDAQVLTFNEDLKKCQYYFETSYSVGTELGAVTEAGAINNTFFMRDGDTNDYRGLPFNLDCIERKRAAPSFEFYSPTDGAKDFYDYGVGYQSSWSAGYPVTRASSNLNQVVNTPDRAFYTDPALQTSILPSPISWYRSSFHYTANARLGE